MNLKHGNLDHLATTAGHFIGNFQTNHVAFISQYGLPVLTLPFVLSTMLLILTTDERSSLSRIHEAMGYPERHAYRRYTLTRSARKVNINVNKKLALVI